MKMTIQNLKGKTEDKIPIKNVIVSVFDKNGLEELIVGLTEINPDIRFMSTGGTYKRIKDILGNSAENNLIEIADYTECPEMEGGLVKTLHPKIHAGILGERNNPEHQRYLAEDLNGAVYIDMVVVNLYPFNEVIANPDTTFEEARSNIDIGGPTMIRAAAKNFPGCAVVCDTKDYTKLLKGIKENSGYTTFDQRLNLAKKVFALTSKYDNAIVRYMVTKIDESPEKIRKCYEFGNEGK